MKFYHLHLHSNFSLLDGITKNKELVEYCSKYNVGKIASTDHGNIANVPAFQKEMNKNSIHGINGCELYLTNGDSTVKDKNNRKLSHLVVLAQNEKGYKNLIKIVSKSNSAERFYYKPRLNLEELRDYVEGIITFSGHPGSDMFNILWEPGFNPYDAATYEEVLQYLRPDWKKHAKALAEQYRSIFGDKFYFEIQIIDSERLPAAKLAAECLRELGQEMGIRRVATADPHYPKRTSAADQQVVLAASLNTTLPKIRSKINNDEEFGLSGFFRSNNYHLWSPEEMIALHKGYEDEIEMTEVIADMCESYSILSKPKLPIFDPSIPSEQLLREICKRNWRDFRAKDGQEERYGERIKTELAVINNAGLADYFLIIHDIVNYAKSRGWPTGLGRGSAAGSLVLNLLGITAVDPIARGLIFERFYNEGRNSADNISMPDVDLDFATAHRPLVVEYIRGKFGYDRTAQIATFSRMQGRGALKDVLRAHEACSFDEMNEITSNIPDESAISDQLQEMADAGEDPSIIVWALENLPKELSEYCRLEDDGTFVGPYAQYFEQAVRLEGTRRSQGKHAAGVVISPDPLDMNVPLVYDKNGPMSGYDKVGAELCGILKIDILGVSVLDKIDGVGRYLRGESV